MARQAGTDWPDRKWHAGHHGVFIFALAVDTTRMINPAMNHKALGEMPIAPPAAGEAAEDGVWHTRSMRTGEKWLCALGLLAFALVVALTFKAYLSPAMLIDIANLRLCV